MKAIRQSSLHLRLLVALSLSALPWLASGADAEPVLPKLSVEQIVAKHIAARGAIAEWKSVHGLQLSGEVEAGKGSLDVAATRIANARQHFPVKEGTVSAALPTTAEASSKQVLLPIVMDFERPNKSRVEVQFDGKTALQVFDGSQGWKLRPFLNRSDVEPFTADELKSESARAEPEGFLVDYAAKGSRLALDGTEMVEGKPAWRLKVTRKDGRTVHVWVDAASFLDVKVEGSPRRMDGKPHPVYVMQRDFRKIGGVMMPFVLETMVEGYPGSHRLLVEKAVVNPKFEAATFVKPSV
jgi:hypothetical protein